MSASSGLGVGALPASYLGGLGLPILLPGVLHAWGMIDKHRIENRQGAPRVWWSSFFHWVCWGSPAALLAYVIWRRVGS